MRPSSAQRRSCGNTLPGLSRWLGSKAHLTRICWSRSISLNISGIRSRFSTPTPCSPVSTPPTSTQSRRMSAPKLFGLVEFARLVGVVEDQRMQIAVAGVEDVGDAQAVLLRQLAHAGQHLRQFLARDGAVHAVIVGRDAADRRERRLAAGPEGQPLRLRRRDAAGGRAVRARRSPRPGRSDGRPRRPARRVRRSAAPRTSSG